MDTIGAVGRHIYELLGPRADALGRSTGFIQRARKLTGSGFAQLLVGGRLSLPEGSLSSVCRLGAMQRVSISAQGLAQRFDARSAEFIRALLGEAAQRKVQAAEPRVRRLLERFTEVWLLDTTVLALPPSLAEQWPGTGSRNGLSNAAALKAEVGLELKHGALAGPALLPGRAHDLRGPAAQHPRPPGSLQVADLGYFSFAQFTRLEAEGAYFLSRLRAGIQLRCAEGGAFDLLAHLAHCARRGIDQDEQAVRLGVKARGAARLLILKAPPEVSAERRRKIHAAAIGQGRTASARTLALADWTLLITNAPSAQLSAKEALSLYAARWQIELLFKLWKRHGGLGRVHSLNPYRVLSEHYARLLALLLQHWLILGVWSAPALSLVKAAELIRMLAPLLFLALSDPHQLRAVISQIVQGLKHECHQNRRRKRPSTNQTLDGDGLPWGLN